jgi:protein-L-isoaspartate(D-aspartate) O-methyltransferase
MTSRERMIDEQIRGRDVRDARVLLALARVPRELFVPEGSRHEAYEDHPVPIGHGQTISQPYIVAYMTEALRLHASHRVLEIGTGCGYQTAVLADLAREVYSVELIPALAADARARLDTLGYRNVHIQVGDGYNGWPEHAPYDRIMVTAAPDLIPPALLQQLKPGGRMVIPTGIPDQQQLILVEKNAQGRISTRDILPVRFSELEQPAAAAGRG